MARFSSVDDYIGRLPENVQELARSLRDTIMKSAPGLVETIRYDMPAFRSGDATVVYFAVWKKHIGLYPIYRGSIDLERELEPFRRKTDTVQFPLNRPIPHDLVARIVASQMSRNRSWDVDGPAHARE